MDAEGSYRLGDYADVEGEVARLRAQALLGWPEEERFLRERGVDQVRDVLEVGSGPGFVTEQLLRLAPHATVVTLDNDPEMLRRASALLGEHPRVRPILASVYETGLPDRSADAVLARLVFQHLSRPAAAASELFRVTRPGGTLTVVDVDDDLFGVVDPPFARLGEVLDAFASAQTARGGDRRIGRRLWRLLEAAGFVDLRLRLTSATSDEAGIEPFIDMLGPHRLDHLVGAGLLERSVVADAREHIERMRSQGYAMVVLVAVSGRRPGEPS